MRHVKGMRSGLLLFSAGCGAPLLLPALPASPLCPLLLLALVLPALRLRWLRTACFIAGLAWAFYHSQQALAVRLPESLAGQTLLLHGAVVSLPDQDSRRIRFLFDVERLHDAAPGVWPAPGRVRLNWYRNRRQPGPPPQPGERWQLQVRLKPPRGFMNPGGFDYETWLFSRRIAATGYVLGQGRERRLGAAQGQYFNRIRYRLRERFAEHNAEAPQHGLVRALALGDRSGISPEQWSLLRRTGTNHLLAISGLHIALVAGFVFYLARAGWSVFPFLSGRLPAPRFATAVCLLAALWYAGMAGFSLPAQRACIMLALFLSGQWLGRRWRISGILSAALAAVLLRDPLSFLAVDFWLSFSAVCIIAYLGNGRFPARRAAPSRWLQLVRLQCLIPLGLSPLLLLYFQEVSICSVLANLAAIPAMGLFIVPSVMLAGLLFLCGIDRMADPLVVLADGMLGLLFAFFSWLGQWSYASWAHPAPAPWAALLAALGLCVLFAPRALPGRGLGLFLLLPMLFPEHEAPAWGRFHLHLLDVGQGLSVLVQTRNHVLIYDAGDAWTPGFDAAGSVIIPSLRQLGLCRRVDMLILSHSDRDHIGGADSLMAACPPGVLLSNNTRHSGRHSARHPRGAERESAADRKPSNNIRQPARHSARQHTKRPALPPAPARQPARQPCLAGREWTWDGVHFSILHPRDDAAHRHDNDHSCVLRISQPGMRALLPGDIEAKGEQQLLAGAPGPLLAAEVLVAPHHGSRSSSSPAFIAAVSPSVVLFAAGYGNRFGFPDQTIIRRYGAARMYSSAGSGGLRVSAASGAIQVREHRRRARRFWHAPVSVPQAR